VHNEKSRKIAAFFIDNITLNITYHLRT